MEALLEVLHTIAHIVHPFEIALKKFSAILLLTASFTCSFCRVLWGRFRQATGKDGNPVCHVKPKRNMI